MKILDISFNRLKKFDNIPKFQKLTDFWFSNNKIENIDDLIPLKNLPNLETVYVSGNPVFMIKSYR